MITQEFNVNELEPALLRLLEGLSDMSPLYGDLGEMLVQSTQDRVLAGESPDGEPFAPRAQSTLDRYARLGLTFGAPLNRSGDMRSTLFYEASANGLSWGSNAIQSAVMQLGASKGEFGTSSSGASLPWGDIPARPFIGISEEDEVNIIAEITEWLTSTAGD